MHRFLFISFLLLTTSCSVMYHESQIKPYENRTSYRADCEKILYPSIVLDVLGVAGVVYLMILDKPEVNYALPFVGAGFSFSAAWGAMMAARCRDRK